MSVLNKLQFGGFRSFAPGDNDVQTIHFKTPLTLFLGDNGSGKSTIIEVLKFATSGIFPTGSKQGHYFIHYPTDPHQSEVNATMELTLNNVKNDNVKIDKGVRIQLSANRAILKCVRYKSSITTCSNGIPSHISNRIAEVDLQASVQLGVSGPILENVIFCQQDDSNWPLDEAKKLKEKFDAIFNTVVYNNLLEKMRSIIRKNEELLKNKKRKLDESVAIEKELNEKKQKIIEKEESKVNFEKDHIVQTENIEQKRTLLKILQKKKNEVDDVKESIVRYQTHMANLSKQSRDLTKFIKNRFEGTDDELESEINKLKRQLMPTHDLKEIEIEKRDLLTIEKDLKDSINQKKYEYSKLLAEHTHHLKLTNEFTDLKSNFEAEFPGELSKIPEMKVDTLKSYLKEFSTNFHQKVQDVQNQEKGFQSQFNQMQLDIAKLDQTIAIKQRQIESNENNTAKLKKLLTTYKNTDKLQDQLIEINKNFDEINQKIQAKHAEFDESTLKSKLDGLLRNKSELEASLKTISKDLVLLEKIESKREAYRELMESENVFLGKYEQFLRKHNWTKRSSLINFLNNLEIKSTKNVEKLKSESNDLRNKLTIDKADQKRIEEQLAQHRSTVSKLKVEIDEKSSGNIKDIDITLMTSRINIDEIKKRIGLFSATKTFYESYISSFECDYDVSCPTCKQPVTDRDLRKTIVQDLHDCITRIPGKIRNLEEELLNEESRLQDLTELQQKINKTIELNESIIPELEKRLDKTNDSLNATQKIYEHFENNLSGPDKDLRILISIQKEANMFEANSMKVIKLSDEIAEFTNKISITHKESNMITLSESEKILQKSLNSFNSEIEETREIFSKHMNDRFELQNQLKDLIQKRQKIEKDNRQLVLCEGQIEELTKNRVILLTEIEKSRNELSANNEQLSNLQVEYDYFIENTCKNIGDEKVQKNAIEGSLKEILRVLVSLGARPDCEQSLKQISIELNEMEEEQCVLCGRIRDVDNKLNNIHENTKSIEIRLRELEDQLHLRDLAIEVNVIKDKLDRTRQQLAELDPEDIDDNILRTNQQLDGFKERIYTLNSSITNIKDFLKVAKEDVKRSKFNSVNDDIVNHTIDLMILKRMIADLKIYASGMEWSIMQFHRQKMVQINEIIRTLWKNVYKGNDFEYIEIKTQVMEIKGPSNRRSYNYKVVYMKNGVEMDMRGHCSAGQRVLACLIIRIALAEIFSHDCGVLALDEPTTNLDSETILALAESLAELIKERQNDKFQLLLITHDEQFVQLLAKSCEIESYYKVFRNGSGNSLVLEESAINLGS